MTNNARTLPMREIVLVQFKFGQKRRVNKII